MNDQIQGQEINTVAEATGPIVAMNGVYKSFEGHQVLKGVDITVSKGENLVVLGKSGSGKSVLIKCIVGLVSPEEGEVRVFGENISALKYKRLNEIRVKIGFLFQSGALYDSMTVGENLAFPLKQHFKKLSKAETEKIITEGLDDVGLKESVDTMPSELSGGMRKRIGLARTLILKPDIMLYDEPTTGLDTITAKEISELIIRMQEKNQISSIIITHDLACAKITADRIVMLKDGVITAEGTYDELAKSSDEWVKSFFM
ncbi:MAG TPA: ABC transporter ATP-binding protein [Puia sp.]|jgi:phospholipid/cholesterol/gamma-HCH transport system ATP-binding protein|nr:ABC transporter ATP-binding protein [Puia sp.]